LTEEWLRLIEILQTWILGGKSKFHLTTFSLYEEIVARGEKEVSHRRGTETNLTAG
jgi:hypothetical protein